MRRPSHVSCTTSFLACMPRKRSSVSASFGRPHCVLLTALHIQHSSSLHCTLTLGRDSFDAWHRVYMGCRWIGKKCTGHKSAEHVPKSMTNGINYDIVQACEMDCEVRTPVPHAHSPCPVVCARVYSAVHAVFTRAHPCPSVARDHLRPLAQGCVLLPLSSTEQL